MNSMLMSFAVAASAAVLAFSPASAEPDHRNKTVGIVGRESFSPDEFFTITFRFTPRHITVHSGDTVTWDNRTTDGHTISVVAPADVPQTVDQINNCVVCAQLIAAHFPNGAPPAGQPVLFLNNFKPGNPPAQFDSPGDSVVAPPPGLGLPTAVSATITAPAGTQLDYICAFHPWMHGTIRVLRATEPNSND